MKLPKTKLTQVIKEQISYMQNVEALHGKFKNSIYQVDPELDYKVLAEAVAKILVEDYGTHNYKPFLSHLVSHLK